MYRIKVPCPKSLGSWGFFFSTNGDLEQSLDKSYLTSDMYHKTCLVLSCLGLAWLYVGRILHHVKSFNRTNLCLHAMLYHIFVFRTCMHAPVHTQVKKSHTKKNETGRGRRSPRVALRRRQGSNPGLLAESELRSASSSPRV